MFGTFLQPTSVLYEQGERFLPVKSFRSRGDCGRDRAFLLGLGQVGPRWVTDPNLEHVFQHCFHAIGSSWKPFVRLGV
jgi:hypothetical protein